MNAPFSIVIPAHNEAAVIGRCLRALLDGAPAEALPEVIVVCNGCTDDTATLARAVSAAIAVVELRQGSKPLALNAGNAQAHALPRFFIDADVVTRYSDLAAVAAHLRDGHVMAGAPRLAVSTADASRAVQAYYRVWCALPYVKHAMVGSGVYGLSGAGLERVGRIPDIISDDGYVRSRFSATERCSLDRDMEGNPVAFTVFPPRTLHSLVSVEIRRRAGIDELRRKGYLTQARRDNTLSEIIATRSNGARLADIATYFWVKILARTISRLHWAIGKATPWNRDDTSRSTDGGHT